MLSREDALRLVREYVKNDRLVKHMLAVEAIMRALARRLGEDEELWGLTGLVHDIDYELTKDNPDRHGLVSVEILKGKVPDETLNAIRAHNPRIGRAPETAMEKALVASDAISGLLIACALVMPHKKLSEVRVKTVKGKFKSKDFARGANRESILLCEELGIERTEFFEIALKALQEIAGQLGL